MFVTTIYAQANTQSTSKGEAYSDNIHTSRSRPGILDSVPDIVRRFCHKELKWCNKNFEEISRLCSGLCLSDRDITVLIETINKINFTDTLPKTLNDLRREEKKAIQSMDYNIYECPISPPSDDRGTCMVANKGRCELIMYDILETCGNLLNTSGHAEYLHWYFEPAVGEDLLRNYNEMWTGDWWEEEEAALPCSGKGRILAICIATDETHVTLAGKKLYPIYLFLGNYHRWFKNKGSGWALLGFQPVITSRKGHANRTAVRRYKREVRRWVMDKLTEEIRVHEHGFVIDVRSPSDTLEGLFVYPRLALFAADEQELLRSVYGGKGGRCWKPCRLCEVSPRQDGPDGKGLREHAEFRNKEDITKFFDVGTKTSSMTSKDSADLSIHTEFNMLFFVPGFSPLDNPSCRMHQTDAGVFKSMMDDIVSVLREYGGNGCIARFDAMWDELLSVKGYKTFKSGVTDTTLLTAGECRCLSMNLPFVLRGVDYEYSVSENMGQEKAYLEYVAVVYIVWRWLLELDSHDDETIGILTIMGDLLQLHLEKLRKCVKHDEDMVITEGPKFHNISHWNHWIRRYGCTGNYNTETFEKAHRIVIKKLMQKLALKGNYAEKKVMFQQRLYDAHAVEGAHEGDEEINEAAMGLSPNTRKKRWGRGGFRGRVDVGMRLGLSNEKLRQLELMEGDVHTSNMYVEELKESYDMILGMGSRHDFYNLGMLVAILESAKGFRSHITSSSQSDVNATPPHVTIFSPNNPFNITLWNKSRVQEDMCYVEEGSVVKYHLNLVRMTESYSGLAERDCDYTGIVRWIFSIRQCQYMVVQRLNELAYPHGPKRNESTLKRLRRIAMMNSHSKLDMLRCFCHMYKLADGFNFREHGSFDVLWLDGPEHVNLSQRDGVHAYPVLNLPYMQPDLRNSSQSAHGLKAQERVGMRLFLSEFIIA